ncbi:MAG: FkbM family methyltransferase [Bacteroidetes bacterium]|nr:MAG: FkbM family methyltransferase [Bacteroidota bacterium]REK00687.1 MAG: FkbM family methyltransferase [Bacteroidota bacterium]REK35191.1 MAG: FkbM family methyltransferase [Bacteroidota bacterium]REK48268.1 MAG: FkbM family methyltransferase [Bacteroidota bacterium]
MNIFKRTAEKLLDLYLSPLRTNGRISLVASNLLNRSSSHLHGAVQSIRRATDSKNYIVIDVGAFDGGTCIYFAKAFPDAKIMGFEPNPYSFRLAQKNCQTESNIELLNLALDKNAGLAEFYISSNSVSSSLNPILDNEKFGLQEKITVNADNLDHVFAERTEKILLIKLDAQGRELSILQGARKLLDRTEFVLSEMNCRNESYSDGCSYHEVDEFLRKEGFELMNIFSAYITEGISEFDALYRKVKTNRKKT